MAFGDFSYYWIADRQGRSFKRLNELFAATGQVGFLASQRVDGKLILPEAVKTMKLKENEIRRRGVCMLITLEEAKEYLKVEYEDEDTLIQTLIDSSEMLCRDIIRRDILPEDAAVKTAVLYAVGVMFENRGTNEETEKMIPTLKNILSSNREEVF